LIDNGSLLSETGMKQDIIVAKANGTAEGYLVIGMDETERDGIGRVIEFAGKDHVVESLIENAFARYEISQIKLTLPNYRFSLKEKFAAAGSQFRSKSTSGTVKIMDAELLWNSLKPYMTNLLGKKRYAMLQFYRVSNGFRIGYEEESCILDHRGMTNLVFNGVQFIGKSRFKQLLGQVFPLPFENPYNLNYV
jgi:hypothetical protein